MSSTNIAYKLSVLVCAVLLMAGCGGASGQLAQSDWNHQAKETIKSIRSTLDMNNARDLTVEKLADAVRQMEPVIAHPESMRVEVKQDISFDGTPPYQTSVGTADIILTLRQIALAYEQLGAWGKAGEVIDKAIQFADRYNKSHPEQKKSYVPSNSVTDAEYAALYREYARCLERCKSVDRSREYSKLALAKLNEPDKSKQTGATATRWQAAMADSNRSNCAVEYNALGIIAFERGDPAAEIEPLFKRAIELSKPDLQQSDYMQHLGLVLLQDKRYADAQHYFQLASDIMQKEQRWINWDGFEGSAAGLAHCFWSEGKKKEAIATLKTAIAKHPHQHPPPASEALARNWAQLAFCLKASGDPNGAQRALLMVNEQATDLERYAAGLRQSCHILYLADATDAQAARLRSDSKAISGNQAIHLDSLKCLKAEFALFQPPFDGHMGPVYTN